jgi:hypothetical protein
MRRAVVWLALVWFLPAYAASAPERSAVRLLVNEYGRCSAVVMSRHRALTAAHCLHSGLRVDGQLVGGVQIAQDLARLDGDFEPPYAHVAKHAGPQLLLEGYGCDPDRAWLFSRPVRHTRPAELLLVTKQPGLELAIFGRVCFGDSGGAVWNDRGELAGIITARASDPGHAEVLAFGTPAK